MDELTDLRIVVRASPETNDHEVCLLGEDEDLIRRFSDGMMGLDPDEVLIEPCPLAAEPVPRKATIARCSCGVTDCGSVEVLIQRDGDVVTWRATDSAVAVRFSASSYDAELTRALHDRSWETPDRTAARLIRNNVDRVPLQQRGLKFCWASGRIATNCMSIALWLEPGPYQVLVHVPWNNETPDRIAATCIRVLSLKPASWENVTWFPQNQGLGAPAAAGPGWRPGTA